ncbi:MAG: hypothetical protein ABWW69_04015, partial [Pyrodictiaceae archaeon]
MVENRQVLYGIAAGVIAGIISSVVAVLRLYGRMDDFLLDLIYQQLLASGLPGEKALETARRTVEGLWWIRWLLAVGPVINMALLGALLGLLTHVFIKSLGLRPWSASLATGLVLVLLLQLLPLLLLEEYYSGITGVLEEYVGLPVILAPSIT